MIRDIAKSLLEKINGLEKKAQDDLMYYKGAREGIALMVTEMEATVAKMAEQKAGEQEAKENGRPKNHLAELRKGQRKTKAQANSEEGNE